MPKHTDKRHHHDKIQQPNNNTHTFHSDHCCANVQHPSKKHLQKESIKPYVRRAILAGLVGLPLFVCSLLGITFLTYDLIAISILAIPLSLYVGSNIYRNAWHALKHYKITMDTLFAISTFITMAISIISIAYPPLSLAPMFEAALMILGFRNIGLAIEKSATYEVLKNLSLTDSLPTTVKKIKDPQSLTSEEAVLTKKIALEKVKPEDVIQVKAGEIIPLDGIIVNAGTHQLYNTVFTGDIYPKVYQQHNAIRAGMKLVTGHLQIKVTREKNESELFKIDAALKNAQTNKARIKHVTDQVVQYFVPAIVLIALSSYMLVSHFISPILAINTAISVLCISCPCVFAFLVPLSNKIATSKAAKHGAYIIETNHHGASVKNASLLENLAKVDTIVFDLNGTLTQPQLSKVISYTGWELEKILYYAKILEQDNPHIIAKTIQAAADTVSKQEILSYEKSTLEENKITLGETAIINGKEYLLGDPRLLAQENSNLEHYQNDIAEQQNEGNMPIIFAEKTGITYTIIALLILDNQLTENAKGIVTQLKGQGIDIKLCTGSHASIAQQQANLLGISKDNIAAQKKPEEKQNFIKKLQEDHNKTVAMVGDGLNDSIALAESDVGIVMQSDHSICPSTSHIKLANHALKPILHAITIARQAMATIKQNLFITLIYNSCALAIAGGALIHFGILINPAIATAFMILETSCVLLNTYYFKYRSVSNLSDSNDTHSSTHNQVHAKIKFVDKSAPISVPLIPFPPVVTALPTADKNSLTQSQQSQIISKTGLYQLQNNCN